MTAKNTAPAVDERDAEIQRLRDQLAALAPRTEDERDRAERRALELADEREEAEWLVLATDKERLAAMRGIVGTYRLQRFYQVIGTDACERLAREDKKACRRILETHPNKRALAIILTPDDKLPQITRVTGQIGKTEDVAIDPETADRARALGIEVWAGDRTWWYRGIAIQGRVSRLVNSDAWALRAKIDADIAAALTSGRLTATPLDASAVRALMIRGETLP